MLGAALLVAALLAAPAHAEDGPRRAQTLFQQAEARFARGDFPGALRLYLEAHEAKPLPELLFNVGQCHRHLGNHERAVFFYRQFLEQKPRSPQRAQVQQLIDECQAALARTQRGGRDCPAPPVPPVAATAEGDRTTRVLFWSSVGLAGALVVAGAITGGVASRQDAEYAAPGTSPARRQELGDMRRRLETASWACLGLAATAGVGAALLGWFSRAPAQPATVTFAPAPVGGGGGLVVDGRF